MQTLALSTPYHNAFPPTTFKTLTTRRSHFPLRAAASTDSNQLVETPPPPAPATPTVPPTPRKLNLYSSRITEPKSQGGSQAILYGVGLSDEDMGKPQVGISSVWYEGNTCNMHLLSLAEAVREGVREAGMVGFRFNTIGVSDAISMGTRGMCYSLQSRDLIADSIETVMSAQWYDANISIPGCDKNMPGTIMAMGRLNRPSLMIYGGTIKPGHFQGNSYDIISAFQCYGEYVSGSISDDQRLNVVRNSCPGAGACGGMYTANTMASAIETMGMTLPYSSSTPAEDPLKLDECRLAGKYLLELLKMDLKPRDIITDKSLRNAMVIVMALGGSTNAVMHLIAIARSVGLHLTLDDFQKVSDKVPFLADLKPSGKYVMEDLHKIGGTPAVIRYLLEEGFLDGNCMTVTGKTLEENAKTFSPLAEGQQVIRPLENPIKSTGHIQILYGNLAPEGSVAKITGKEGLFFSGPALVFDGEELMIAAISENPMNFKGKVVVIRGEGPKGGPGMPEMLTPTSAIMGAGLGKECALLTDGRFSGGSHGYVVGHICPEAQEGGPIGLIQNGDVITIDILKKRMDVELTEQELEERRKKWSPPAYKAKQGVLYKYIKNVQPASRGCVTDE
ncbi:dihydroxy-acid dehydratase, chloroplastic [Typha latifolia]|uniref:dihydroxy-acid dehydratase, chloroplastic n=1 Tax=Typha latifolia TaxID=4733 RepID=UPI003C2E442F